MKLKRVFNLSIIFVLLLFMANIFYVKASLVPLTINGQTVKYRGTSIEVLIPEEYTRPETEFRGVWVTPIVGGNLARFISVEQYKAEIIEVLDIMDYYNLNALIFHVRPFNDALYSSKLNPWSHYLRGYNANPGWDPLPWIIEETHKRGIEFHAWLNPYRVNPSDVNNIPSYNIGSDKNNLLISSDNKVILNPGEPAVRDFLVATVMEIIENYDVDGIHFDDYFYINNIDDTHTRNKPGYNPKNLNASDWRREQINTFIKQLSTAMRDYNQSNNRLVQLGISPTGIYKNGGSGFAEGGSANYDSRGNFITNGSNTAGQEHYQSYLFSDTKKWVDEEWIDYIIPQTYWGFTHPVAGYADVLDWWAKVVRNKKVNLYSGMGIYMSESTGNTYSWKSNNLEGAMQILYNTKHEHVRGTTIFSYSELKKAYKNSGNSVITSSFSTIKNEYWNIPILTPEIRTYTREVLSKVNDLQVNTYHGFNELRWENNPDATKYAIYRSVDESINNEDLIAVIGNDVDKDYMVYDDNVLQLESYHYKVVPISKTNTLGEESVAKSESLNLNQIGHINNIKISSPIFGGELFTLEFDKLAGKDDVNYSTFYSNDLKTWVKIDSQLKDEGSYFSQQILAPKSDESVFLKILAENNEGSSSKVIELEYTKTPNLPRVRNSMFKGDLFQGSTIEFSWDMIESDFYSNVEYQLEISTDNITFTPLKGDYYIKGNRVYQNVRLPLDKSIYVRINTVSEKHDNITYGQLMLVNIKTITYNIQIDSIIKNINNQTKHILS